MSQTAMVIGISNAGKKPTGGIASAPMAPAEKAMRRRGHHHARMMLGANAFRAPERLGGVGSEDFKFGLPVRTNQ